ncbi:MAG: UDP-N-acetylmuramate--L-alanine ligase [Actinobacteria bacterium]|nr:UDP-N-acetylmuramate--L-alanine ligase [Actinomycetota bacterium]
MIKPDLNVTAPKTWGKVHFVGIGGSGMSGIARMFVESGISVTGSDSRESSATHALRDLGVEVSIGHDAAHVGSADQLVVTGALWQDNPEYLLALERGIPVFHRAQALEWLTRSKRLVSVAGAHGKTTSTGMLITALKHLGEDPGFVNGGVVHGLGRSAQSGSSNEFVVEADESDGSFLIYSTAVALITNVDPDHLDHYGSHDAFIDAFVKFASAASELVVISADDPGAISVSQQLSHDRVITFGEDPGADARISVIDTSAGNVRFVVVWNGESFETTLRVPGRHNAINAAGVFAVLVGMGFDPASSMAGIAKFGGTERRFELHAVVDGVSVYDDYAHHPTEVDAVLSAARTVVGAGRLIALQQPHLYSRTAMMCVEFAEVLENKADVTVCLDVYGAREDPVPGVTGELVTSKFADPQNVFYEPDWAQAAARIAEISRPGDFVITLGCGDVYRIIPQVVDALTHRAPLA